MSKSNSDMKPKGWLITIILLIIVFLVPITFTSNLGESADNMHSGKSLLFWILFGGGIVGITTLILSKKFYPIQVTFCSTMFTIISIGLNWYWYIVIGVPLRHAKGDFAAPMIISVLFSLFLVTLPLYLLTRYMQKKKRLSSSFIDDLLWGTKKRLSALEIVKAKESDENKLSGWKPSLEMCSSVSENPYNTKVNWGEALRRKPFAQEIFFVHSRDNERGCPILLVHILFPEKRGRKSHASVVNLKSNLCEIRIWNQQQQDCSRGYGTYILKKMINRCFSYKYINAVIIAPLYNNTRAHTFLERLGFTSEKTITVKKQIRKIYTLPRYNF